MEPNNDNGPPSNTRDAIFGLAGQADSSDEQQQQQGGRRVITMYRNGFVVDDGPYRRLDDPANADFLRALATGRTPPELAQGKDVTVGLIDKRSEEYVETFRSFSGAGTSLGSDADAAANPDGVFDPTSLPEPVAVDSNQPTTSVAVRTINGKRQIVKLNMSQTVLQLAAHIGSSTGDQAFQLVSGFPPTVLVGSQTIEEAGLKGAQVKMVPK